MKALFTAAAIFAGGSLAYAQCTSNGTLTLGACLTNQTLPQLQNGFVSGCNGGNHPFATFQFTAPSTCVDFDITNLTGNGTGKSWQYRILNASCTEITSNCIKNVDDGLTFTVTADFSNGTYALSSGTQYYLQIMGDAAGVTYNICMSNTIESSNSCAGAFGLGTTTTTYYNGGAGCSFDGTLTGGGGDPSAASICAGTLENTQWITFTPTAGTTNFSVVGTNIDCSGGNCAYQFGVFSSATSCGTLVPEGCVSNGVSCGNGPDGSSTNPSPSGTTATYTTVWSGVSTTGFTGTFSIASGTFNGTEKFYLIMDGNAGASCTYTLQGINVAPLPVELVYFTVKKLSNGNLLKFEVASQINNDYYSLERSENGMDWNEITRIDGAGTTNNQIKYNHLDTDFRKVINYYRIKQVDFNGNYEYSSMVAVNNTIEAKEIKACYTIQGSAVDITTSGLIIVHYVDGSIEKIFNL